MTITDQWTPEATTALEGACWVRDVTGRTSDYGDDQIYRDPDPVPALHELRTTGTLTTALMALPTWAGGRFSWPVKTPNPPLARGAVSGESPDQVRGCARRRWPG
jgi:hypothetical protein